MTRPLFLSAVTAFAFATAAAASEGDWEPLPPLPEPNGGFVCGVVGKRIVVVGGTNWEGGTKNWLRAIHEYDPVAGKWKKIKDLQESPVAYAVPMQRVSPAGVGQLAFVGGSDGQRSLQVVASVDGMRTQLVHLGELPPASVLSAGGALGEAMIVVGGTHDAGNLAGMHRAAFSITTVGTRWSVSRLPDYPGKPFGTAASAVAGGELFVFGGANWDANSSAVTNASEAHAFSSMTNAWRKLKPLPFAVRGMTAVALDEHRIYLAGGYRTGPDGFTNQALIYDVKTDSYAPAKPLPYRGMAGLVRLDGHVYCLGGEDKMKSRTDKFFRIPAAALSDR